MCFRRFYDGNIFLENFSNFFCQHFYFSIIFFCMIESPTGAAPLDTACFWIENPWSIEKKTHPVLRHIPRPRVYGEEDVPPPQPVHPIPREGVEEGPPVVVVCVRCRDLCRGILFYLYSYLHKV